MTAPKLESKHSWKNNKTLWGFVVVALILVCYFAVYRPVSINQDKQRFLTAEKEIEALADRIQDKIGKADQIAKDNSCGRANLKNSEGPLLCDVEIDLLYENRDYIDANVLMGKITVLSNEPLRIGSGTAREDSFNEGDSRKLTQTFYQSFSLTDSLSCGYAYSYRFKPDESNKLITSSDENFKLSISCGGPAKAEHFFIR